MAIKSAGHDALTESGVDDTEVWKRPRRLNWQLLIGGLLLGLISAASLGAPFLTQYDPLAQDLLNAGAAPFAPGHLLGTDAPFGRDMFSRLLYGGRVDLLIGIGGTCVTLLIGTLIGMIAGLHGQWADALLMRIADVFFAFPFLVLVLAIVAVLGPGLLNLLLAIWAVGWVSYARIIRGQTLAAKNQEYVLAARASGASSLRIMARHLLPNIVSAALIFAMADVVTNIQLAAALGYLGLGIPEPAPEWGAMIVDGQNYMLTAWWVPTIPGLAIVVVGIALSFIGDGLAEVLRPRR